MGTRLNSYERVAMRKLEGKLPEYDGDWAMSSWEAMDDKSGIVVEIAPCVTPESGDREWPHEGLRRKAMVLNEEIIEDCRIYESETGKCSLCMGDGQMWAGWNHKTGNRFMKCNRCGGSGKPQDAVEEVAS